MLRQFFFFAHIFNIFFLSWLTPPIDQLAWWQSLLERNFSPSSLCHWGGPYLLVKGSYSIFIPLVCPFKILYLTLSFFFWWFSSLGNKFFYFFSFLFIGSFCNVGKGVWTISVLSFWKVHTPFSNIIENVEKNIIKSMSAIIAEFFNVVTCYCYC